MVFDLPEVFLAEAQEGCAVDLRIAADVVMNAGVELLTVAVVPNLSGLVLGVDENRPGVPIVFLARKIFAPL